MKQNDIKKLFRKNYVFNPVISMTDTILDI